MTTTTTNYIFDRLPKKIKMKMMKLNMFIITKKVYLSHCIYELHFKYLIFLNKYIKSKSFQTRILKSCSHYIIIPCLNPLYYEVRYSVSLDSSLVKDQSFALCCVTEPSVITELEDENNGPRFLPPALTQKGSPESPATHPASAYAPDI